MEPTPSVPSAPVQPVTTPPVVAPIPAPKHSKLPWVLLIVVLLVAMGAGGLYLGKQMSAPVAVVPTPAPIAAVPTVVTDPTANWKTYTNSDLTFKYPPTFKQGSTSQIESVSDSVTRINIVSKDSPFMNECMNTVSTEKQGNMTIKHFSSANSGEACSGVNPTGKEIWVQSDDMSKAVGIIYTYSSTDPIAETVFAQILSTFKFTNQVKQMDTSSWKTFTGEHVSFQYPPDWIAGGPEAYLESVHLMNPAKTISMTISKGQYPYDGVASNSKNITVNINGTNMNVVEVDTNTGVYVDFAVGAYHVLYGTDYPAVGTHASLADYVAAKDTLAAILASMKFAN